MVVGFRRARRDHFPLAINGSSVEIVKNIKFLGVHIAENLTWTLNTSSITKTAQQRLYFLRKLREAHYPSSLPSTEAVARLGLAEDLAGVFCHHSEWCVAVWFPAVAV
ncbi:hypothetical protein P4O66_002943 [Electrophorus voltai]|uniref:Alkylated DNA repair protein AlkB homologue 8 N-terminal domain-containing protein n=1 Tax=Electrophorus voltai TaxID=2609070 RepID=A0AAD8YUF3_9TELE|nr:hypothetical protein P4O66_002943 [Electrophorus voltai]